MPLSNTFEMKVMGFILQFERRFCMAHRLLSGSSPKCAIPHGHNEYVRIFLETIDNNTLDNDANMIAVFADAKSTWHQFIDDKLDHSFQIREDDPIIGFFKEHEPQHLKRVITTPGDPTTELMCACLMSKADALLKKQQSKLRCCRIELQETPTNTVILDGVNAHKAHLPSGDYWWNRADFSINDF